MGLRLAKVLRRSVLAAGCLIAVAAAPAHALYYPSGPQPFVDKSQLAGWQPCFTGLYNGEEPLDPVLAACNQELLLVAGGPTGSSTLTVLAAAPRADVIFDTGRSDTPHNANGSGWYFNADWSLGFAKQGDPISRDTCDVLGNAPDPGPNPDLRLCWHTAAGAFDGGYRAGATYDLNSSTDYTRYIYQAPTPSNSFAARAQGKKLVVTVSASGSVSVVDAATPLSASSSKKKKKRKVLLKPSSASGNPPAISVPLLLTKSAKKKLRQKGKVAVKARITFTPEPPGTARTQIVKLKVKGKPKKK